MVFSTNIYETTSLNEREYNNHGMGLYQISLIIAHTVIIHELIAYKLIFHLLPGTDLTDDDELVPFRNYYFLKTT